MQVTVTAASFILHLAKPGLPRSDEFWWNQIVDRHQAASAFHCSSSVGRNVFPPRYIYIYSLGLLSRHTWWFWTRCLHNYVAQKTALYRFGKLLNSVLFSEYWHIRCIRGFSDYVLHRFTIYITLLGSLEAGWAGTYPLAWGTWLGTNLIHDFKAVKFSTISNVVSEKCVLLWDVWGRSLFLLQNRFLAHVLPNLNWSG